MKLASRLDYIEPFHVLEFAKAASQLALSPACDAAQGGTPMVFLNIGEPDFTAPPAVQSAAIEAIRAGQTQYTLSTGLPELKQALSQWYAQRFKVAVAPERIVITAGASAALQLVCMALFEAGDEVLMPDPSYPCNRHFVAATGAKAVALPCGAASRFQLTAEAVAAHWSSATRGVLLASPSNPTGTSIAPEDLQAILGEIRARGGVCLVDEIYLGLSYDGRYAQTALALGEDVISINSFSKYFNMTGWRLGWLVLPEWLLPAVEKLQQNFYICASSVAQHAALACFEPESLAAYEVRRSAFQDRRDAIVPALKALGLDVPVAPDGAFYAWADCSRYSDDSDAFCRRVMQEAHVALTPGKDFGPAEAKRFFRLSFANSLPQLQLAVARLSRLLAS